MSKLIDADGLIAQAQSARFDGKWFDEVIARRAIVRWINSQPDASEPLRKRIAELEVAVRDLIETIDYNRTPNEFFDTRLPEIEALLKGAQDV